MTPNPVPCCYEACESDADAWSHFCQTHRCEWPACQEPSATRWCRTHSRSIYTKWKRRGEAKKAA